MKKNYIFKFILFVIPFSAFVLMSNANGKVNETVSGSPGDGNQTCSKCHSGGNFGASVGITTNIPGSGYEANTAYNITVTTTSSASKHGFQLTAEKINGATKIGTFTAGSNSKTISGSNQSITHNSPNDNSWAFVWNSPASNLGEIKFYVSAIAANGNIGTTGDQVVTNSTGNFNVLGLKKEQQLDFAMYPNPSSDNLNIQLPSGVLKANVALFDLSGRLLLSSNVTAQNKRVNVADISTGVYLVKIQSEGKTGTKQFIKK